MGFFDDAKAKADDAVNAAQNVAGGAVSGAKDMFDKGKDWVDHQGGLDGAKDKATEMFEQAKDKVAGVDLPGEWDDKLKDKLGLGNNDKA